MEEESWWYGTGSTDRGRWTPSVCEAKPCPVPRRHRLAAESEREFDYEVAPERRNWARYTATISGRSTTPRTASASLGRCQEEEVDTEVKQQVVVFHPECKQGHGPKWRKIRQVKAGVQMQRESEEGAGEPVELEESSSSEIWITLAKSSAGETAQVWSSSLRLHKGSGPLVRSNAGESWVPGHVAAGVQAGEIRLFNSSIFGQDKVPLGRNRFDPFKFRE